MAELRVFEPELAAAALIGLAFQVAYWHHHQRRGQPPLTAASLARACAGLFLHGAASLANPSAQGGIHA